MANLCVSDAFLSIPHLLRPQRGHNCRKGIKSATVILASDSRLRVPKRQIDGTKDQPSGFSWMMLAGGNVDFDVVPTSVPVRVAHELLLAGHRFLDVRTLEEFSVGHAIGAVNVPYMFKLGSGMTKNPNFLEEVLSHFGEEDEIIVGCQSGKRSQMAAIELISAKTSHLARRPNMAKKEKPLSQMTISHLIRGATAAAFPETTSPVAFEQTNKTLVVLSSSHSTLSSSVVFNIRRH